MTFSICTLVDGLPAVPECRKDGLFQYVNSRQHLTVAPGTHQVVTKIFIQLGRHKTYTFHSWEVDYTLCGR